MLSYLSRVRLFVTLWTVAHQALLSMGFSRQEYWSGLPCPPSGALPDPGIKPASLMSPALAGRFFTTNAHLGSPKIDEPQGIYLGTIWDLNLGPLVPKARMILLDQ